MTTALVPVKPLDAGKSRLLGSLDREQIRALCLAMLGDVLEALSGVADLAERAVVTPDAEVGAAAERAGARALVRDDPGLNASLSAAAGELCGEGQRPSAHITQTVRRHGKCCNGHENG